jgi:outer membrane protein TolC
MNIPLWQNNYKAAQRQAKANLRKIQEQRTDTENKILSIVFEVIYGIEDSQRKIHLYGDVLVSKAQELVHASETAYKAGTIDFLSLIDAQRMLLKYELEYERAATNNKQKLAELEMLIGKELPSINNSSSEKR